MPPEKNSFGWPCKGSKVTTKCTGTVGGTVCYPKVLLKVPILSPDWHNGNIQIWILRCIQLWNVKMQISFSELILNKCRYLIFLRLLRDSWENCRLYLRSTSSKCAQRTLRLNVSHCYLSNALCFFQIQINSTKRTYLLSEKKSFQPKEGLKTKRKPIRLSLRKTN